MGGRSQTFELRIYLPPDINKSVVYTRHGVIKVSLGARTRAKTLGTDGVASIYSMRARW